MISWYEVVCYREFMHDTYRIITEQRTARYFIYTLYIDSFVKRLHAL